MELICPYCSNKTILTNVALYADKTVRITCKNTRCGQVFEIKVPPTKDNTKILFPPPGPIKKGKLTVIANKYGRTQKFDLTDGPNIIGRDSSASSATIRIVTSDNLISRNHCEIYGFKDPKSGNSVFTIKDLDSKNKVYINGKVIHKDEEIYLSDRDIIKLGMTEIKFSFGDID